MCHLPVVSYGERLTLFNLDKLELRHLRTDLVEMFKIVHGYTKFNVSVCPFHVTMFIMVPEVTVSNSISNVVTKICLNIILQIALCMHVILLPDHCLNTNLISTFKRNVCNVNLSSFIYGQL